MTGKKFDFFFERHFSLHRTKIQNFSIVDHAISRLMPFCHQIDKHNNNLLLSSKITIHSASSSFLRNRSKPIENRQRCCSQTYPVLDMKRARHRYQCSARSISHVRIQFPQSELSLRICPGKAFDNTPRHVKHTQTALFNSFTPLPCFHQIC